LIQDNYKTSKAVRISGMSDAEFLQFKENIGDRLEGSAKSPFIRVDASLFKGKKVKAKIQAGSTARDSDRTRLGKLQGFAQTVLALGPQGAANLDIDEFVKEAAQAFGVANDNITTRKDNPMEESRLLNNGVFVMPRLNEDHEKHLEVHRRESNGSDQNVLHMAGHQMFLDQLQNNQAAQLKSNLKKAEEAPLTGSSFAQGPVEGQPQPNGSAVGDLLQQVQGGANPQGGGNV